MEESLSYFGNKLAFFCFVLFKLSQPKLERKFTEINKQSLHLLHTSTKLSNSNTLFLALKEADI